MERSGFYKYLKDFLCLFPNSRINLEIIIQPWFEVFQKENIEDLQLAKTKYLGDLNNMYFPTANKLLSILAEIKRFKPTKTVKIDSCENPYCDEGFTCMFDLKTRHKILYLCPNLLCEAAALILSKERVKRANLTLKHLIPYDDYITCINLKLKPIEALTDKEKEMLDNYYKYTRRENAHLGS